MMINLTGSDTTILSKLGAQDRIMKDFGDGDVVAIDIPNNLVELKKGKDDNAIIAYNAAGKVSTVTMRILAGGADDKFLNSEITSYQNNRPGYILLSGEFIKKVGDGKGNISNIVFKFSNGIIQKYPVGGENVDGNTDQALSIYQIIFSQIDKIIA
jgi:hypothetical protein